MTGVLFLSTVMPSQMGGARRLYFNLLHFSKKFEVHFIHVQVGNEASEGLDLALPSGVKFTRLRCQGIAPDPAALLFPHKAMRLMKIASLRGQIDDYVRRHSISCRVAFTQDCSFALRSVRCAAKVAEALDSYGLYYRSKASANPGLKNVALGVLMPALYKAAEFLYNRHYGAVVYVSELDRRSSAIPQEKIFVSFDVREAETKPSLGLRRTDFALIGRWQHPPNRDGLLSARPHLGSLRGKVRVIGLGLPVGVEWPANTVPVGFVNDIGAELSQTKVVLLPVWYGAGLQNKVFDALRHGCVVVTTPFTAQSFLANGFSSPCIIGAEDVFSAANKALDSWSPADAKRAYADYAVFREKTISNEADYMTAVEKLASKSSI